MPKVVGIPKLLSSRVGVARQLLQEKAKEILEQYLTVVKEAQAAGDYEVATKSLQWLMEHMPEEEGERMVEVSVDKQKQVEQTPTGPSIRIGIALGGVNQAKLPAITAETVDE